MDEVDVNIVVPSDIRLNLVREEADNNPYSTKIGHAGQAVDDMTKDRLAGDRQERLGQRVRMGPQTAADSRGGDDHVGHIACRFLSRCHALLLAVEPLTTTAQSQAPRDRAIDSSPAVYASVGELQGDFGRFLKLGSGAFLDIEVGWGIFGFRHARSRGGQRGG